MPLPMARGGGPPALCSVGLATQEGRDLDPIALGILEIGLGTPGLPRGGRPRLRAYARRVGVAAMAGHAMDQAVDGEPRRPLWLRRRLDMGGGTDRLGLRDVVDGPLQARQRLR